MELPELHALRTMYIYCLYYMYATQPLIVSVITRIILSFIVKIWSLSPFEQKK